jgi:hypothetical protein
MSTPLPLTAGLRPPLATPHLSEAIRATLGQQLENYLAPLVAYCDELPANEQLALAEFRHGYELRQAIDALLRYDAQTEQLLTYYRQALAAAQQLATSRLPSLEQALATSLPPPDAQPR